MGFRGALLKPSERNGAGRSAKASRSVSKQSRYEVLKEKIRNWWEDRFKVGAALQEIRDQKLYQGEHGTFEEFCQSEYGFERAHAYRLIGFAEVKASVQMSPIGDKIKRESQARALAPVPEEKRVEVLEEVAAQGPITAKAITEVAERVVPKAVKQEPPKEEEKKHLDKTGYVIPESILEDWQRAEAFNSVLREISKVKSILKKGLDESDLIFAEVNNTTISTLTNAYGDLKRVLPHAVCPTCQGRTPKKCTTCRGRGFVSEFYYTSCVPEETKKLRERAIKK